MVCLRALFTGVFLEDDAEADDVADVVEVEAADDESDEDEILWMDKL